MNPVKIPCTVVGCKANAVCTNHAHGHYLTSCSAHCDHAGDCVCLFNGKRWKDMSEDEKHKAVDLSLKLR